ncbi:HTH-type transcriptional regulator malT [Janibacter hoylei PVAS-1]|uniref:HTH-type transcriptional regulator malT n=1 Tax=Janibacter hoylei PVAS-1 TaxID=1210046 RepID=K1E7I1_9MICO|nr:LuxR family transcriptional regulator [Janibacter hoylei]EKA61372.1 HTH-type transcriptional regulator malT [Janibacter hoylei PVAS-1]
MHLAAQHDLGGVPAPVGRARLVAAVTARVLDGQAIAVHGPRGMGRSTFLDLVAAGLPQVVAVRLQRPGVAGHGATLIAQAFEDDVLDELPASMRTVLLDAEARADAPGSRLADALTELLTARASRAPFVLVVDDAQHLDESSLTALRVAAGRSLGPGAVGMLLGVGPGEPVGSAGFVPTPGQVREVPVLHIDLEPLAGADTVEMLAAVGVPTDTALWAHRESGGNPGIAHEIAATADEFSPSTVSRAEYARARERVQPLSEVVLATLRRIAVMHQPTVEVLIRLGGREAAQSIRTARALALVVDEDDYLRLTPGALADVLLESVDSDELVRLHRELADHAGSEALTRYHRALAGDPSTRPADLASSAAAAAARGEHDLAAHLYLLAADAGTPQRAEWLTCCLENAVIGKETRVLHRAIEGAAELTEPHQRVRADLALLELDDSSPDEVLIAALHASERHPELQARVLLQRARILLGTHELRTALDLARRSVDLAGRAGRPDIEVEALTVAASVSRSLGEGSARELIEQAASLAGPPRPGQVHTSPRYIAARFALHDDDLRRARSEFVDLLAGVGPDAGYDTVHVLRSLVEVVARQGRGREALELAARATRAASHFHTPVATTWYIEALAELVGGTFERAALISSRGVDLAREQGDERYLRRQLAQLGLARLHLDELDAAVAAYRELRRIDAASGIRDVTALRWHTDAVTALALVGETDEAAALLAEVRSAVEVGLGAPGTGIAADRAEAEIAAAEGDLDGARLLVTRSATAAAERRLPIEQARSLVALAHIERRARRTGRSLEAAARAREVLRPLHADPWAAWVQARFPEGAALHSLEPEEPEGADPLAQLTLTEQQVAGLVADGASNREIAQRLHLSVKTVEGTLTRIYRKSGVRSRTQLATLVLGRRSR